MRPASADEARLADWLHQLVALLLAEGGGTARRLQRVVGGRRALLQLDGARLVLHARAGEPFGLTIEPAERDEPVCLRTSGDALRDVMEGRALLDAVVASDRLHLRAGLPQLLAFHELVLHVLDLGTRHPGLQALWAAFDAGWPGHGPACARVDGQRAVFGRLREALPEAVRQARSPLAQGPAAP